MACPKETSGHCFADHWGGNHGRLALIISHTHLSSLTTNLSNPHESFYSCLNPTPIRVDSSDSWSFTNAIRGYCLDQTYSCRFERFVVSISVLTPLFLWFPWFLCALIRTSIRAIRAECGEVTHSASPSTIDIRIILIIRDLLNHFRPFRLFVFFRNYNECRMDVLTSLMG